MNSASVGIADPSKVDCVLEFFSASDGKWIPVEIIDRSPDGAVQVCAKPGKWLSAADCKRKLRARVYADDPTIGSTIVSADAFLQAQESPKAQGSPKDSPKAPSTQRRSFASIGENNAAQPSKQPLKPPLKPPVKPPPTSGARAPQLDSSVAEAAGAGYPRKIGGTSTLDEIKARPSQSLSVPAADPTSFQPCPETSDAPRRSRSSYSCPRCGASDLPSFETAVQHCAPEQAENSQTPTSNEDSAKTPTITDLPPGYEAGRQRNGLRFVRGSFAATMTVPVAIPKESDESEKDGRSPVASLPSAPLLKRSSEPRRAEVLSVTEVKDERDDLQPTTADLLADVGGETDSTRSSENQRSSVSGPPAPPVESLLGEAIAYNIKGEPIIARSVSSDTGAGVTIVLNDDGTKCTFGQNTLASLMSSDHDDAQTWIGSLTTLETRGLVHEIGQVLLSTSAVYQFHLNRLNALSEKSHYSFFGLTEDATDKEIDAAYKKMAKQMHPDKNGGTAEAKEKFQQMKERYEALKERRANGEEPKGRKDSDGEKSNDTKEGDDEGDSEPKRKEAYDEDEDEAPKKKESGQISYDPTDQDSLATTAMEMLQRLKAIEGSMTTVKDQLRKHGL